MDYNHGCVIELSIQKSVLVVLIHKKNSIKWNWIHLLWWSDEISVILAELHNMKILFDNDEYPKNENFYKIKRCMSKTKIYISIKYIYLYITTHKYLYLRHNLDVLYI